MQICYFCSGRKLIRYYGGVNFGMEKGCKGYVGTACVNGTCPKTMKEEYEEQGRSAINCSQCFFNRGCEDCALADTEYCSVGNGEEGR